MPSASPAVNAYFLKAPAFAQPILVHLRALVHQGCPNVEETMKWSRPFFEYRSATLCNIAAFKAHCSFGFWGEEIGAVLREANALGTEGMGSLGRITSLQDLPSDQQMLGWIRQASAFIDGGQHTSPIAARRRVVKAPVHALVLPEEFTSALEKNKDAAAAFAAFNASCKREYVEWIVDAKRTDTRNKRITTALTWIKEGKQRNWKYQNC